MSTKFTIKEKRVILVLSQELAAQVKAMNMRYALWESGCITSDSDHGPWGREYIIKHLPVERTRIYTGIREAGSYNHHSQITKFKGRYYFAWSNGIKDEDTDGQRTLLSSSADGRSWTKAQCIVPADARKGEVRMALGLYAGEDELVLYSHLAKRDVTEAESATMGSTSAESSRLDTYTSKDGKNWILKAQGIARNEKGHAGVLFEAPRPTKDGVLLAGGTLGRPVVFRWEASNPAGSPEVVKIPAPSDGGAFPYGEATWYQTDDGTIVMFWRDEAASLRLYVNYSEDGGETWSEPLLSDFPDSMSRVSAGRLPDGRFFLTGNSYAKLLDRMHLMISISEDGYRFSKMYTLLDDPTAQRTKGLLKCHGYQYPCVLVDGERLLIGYSVNKEDIECGIVKISDF